MHKNLEFLKNLDKKLHFVEKCRGSGPWEHYTKYFDSYTDKKMNNEEIEKVIKISKKLNYVIYPINTCVGFSVGYAVRKINPLRKSKLLLAFKESQLPKDYTFEKMSETFMSKGNLVKAKLIGEKIVNNYSHYNY